MKAAVFGVLVSMLAVPASAEDIVFDLYGVRIGDTREAVETALSENGFELAEKGERRGPTFEEAIALRNREIGIREAVGDVQELNYVRGTDRVLVEFTPWPDGTSVSRVIYRPELVIPDDCPGFLSAVDERYGHGIEYAGDWIDRPLESERPERKASGTVSVSGKCAYSKGVAISMSLWQANGVFREMLDEADGEPKHDF